MNDLESLVRLNLTGMVGSALLRRLTEQFPLAAIHRLSRRDLERVAGVGPLTSKAIVEAGDPRPEIERAAQAGIDILPCTGTAYPPSLRTLYDHPIVLYRQGTILEGDALAEGIVGSRGATEYGLRQAARFGQELARLRLTVVSGLARGVDTAAHQGALRAPEGRTIAVLGSGLLRVYPPENGRLLREIRERGAAFSEFPVLSGPEATRFPRRNRLISGLSLGVLVVEAADRSGALITADWALEQGRDVFCIPGSIESPMSRGCHRLIRQGAKLVEEPADLLEEIPAFAALVEPSVDLTPLERAVLRRLSDRPSTGESVAAATRLPASSVDAALDRLVGKGVARRDGDARFLRAASFDTIPPHDSAPGG